MGTLDDLITSKTPTAELVAISLSQTIKEIMAIKESHQYHEALKYKNNIEEILNNEIVFEKKIQEAKDYVTEKTKKIEELKKQLENNDIDEFDRRDINRSINWLMQDITPMQKRIDDPQAYRQTLVAKLGGLEEDVHEEYLEYQKQLDKYKDMFDGEKIDTKNIKCLISGTYIEEKDIDKYIEAEFSYYKVDEKVKDIIKNFINELIDENKLYQPRKENKIDLADIPHPYTPIGGVMTMEEFEKALPNFLTDTNVILRNLEAFKKNVPELFSNMSAVEIAEKYAINKPTSEEKKVLENFDKQYKENYSNDLAH